MFKSFAVACMAAYTASA